MHNFINNIRLILFLIIFLLLLIFLENIPKVFSSSSHLLINEVLYNPEGTDTGNEWIELYNPTDIDISIKDWSIERAGTAFEQVLLIQEEITIPSETYFLICGEHVIDCDLYTNKLGFQNGGGTTDGIRLLDNENTVIDALFYDKPNTNQLYDENGILVTDGITAMNTPSGESLGRINDLDTDNYNIDFKVFTTLTPDEINFVKETSEEIIQEEKIQEEKDVIVKEIIESKDIIVEEERTELVQTGFNILPLYLTTLFLLPFIIHKYSAILLRH